MNKGKNNLNTLNISEFTDQHTLYIRDKSDKVSRFMG